MALSNLFIFFGRSGLVQLGVRFETRRLKPLDRCFVNRVSGDLDERWQFEAIVGTTAPASWWVLWEWIRGFQRDPEK